MLKYSQSRSCEINDFKRELKWKEFNFQGPHAGKVSH